MLDRAGYKNGLSVEYSQMPPSIHPARQRTLGKTRILELSEIGVLALCSSIELKEPRNKGKVDGQMVEMEYSGRQIRACRFESGTVRKQNNRQWQIKSTNRK